MTLAVFDVGGTAVKYGIWKDNQLSGQASFETPATWDEMKDQLQTTFNQLKAEQGEVLGAAFSCPGVVDAENGIINGISAVPYVHYFPIRDELEVLLGVPVSIENDANCAALAEVWQGAGADVQNALFLVIGSGIGGAVIMNKQLVKGSNLFGGEFGYMLLEEDRTLSDIASPVKAARYYQEEKGLEETVTGKQLFQLADECDELALKHLTKLKKGLARAIQMLAVAFNPDKVIIGGGISSRDDLITDVSDMVQAYLERTNATDLDVEIVACQYRNDANLVGAVASFLEQKK